VAQSTTTTPHRALARVNLGAVERNCARLKALTAPEVALCAVVKADGYGHGAVECARAALDGGASWLAVATAAEALELRAAGVGSRILVMGALTPDETRAAVGARADVVVWDPDFLEALGAHGADLQQRPRVHLKLDTGMGRLGTKDPHLAHALLERADQDERLEAVGAMTHFATADEIGDEHFGTQLGRFTRFVASVRGRHPRLLCHAANSAATFRDPAAHFDMVRCGVAVYGLDPFLEDPAERGLEPALELTSYVARVERFEPGQSAGYGRRWAAVQPTFVATVPIGYGDGWRRALSGDCDVLIGGERHPLVGTVSMDNVTIDLGRQSGVRPGEEVVLIGARGSERILAEEVAGRIGTINYEVTCGLTGRVLRAHGA
jgi:alanine racemase